MRGIYGKTPAQRFKSLGGKVNQLQMLTWLTVSTPSAVGLTLAVDAFFFFSCWQLPAEECSYFRRREMVGAAKSNCCGGSLPAEGEVLSINLIFNRVR